MYGVKRVTERQGIKTRKYGRYETIHKAKTYTFDCSSESPFAVEARP